MFDFFQNIKRQDATDLFQIGEFLAGQEQLD